MRYSLPLGRLAGIKIFVHWTFVFLVAWIVFSNLRAENDWAHIAWTLALVIVLFGCVTLHEMGHALTARRYEIKTRYITLLPIGGIARMDALPEKPGQELAVALAGPVVNIAIAALIFPFSQWGDPATDAAALQHINAHNFLYLLMALNLWLAIFNLIPAFPMDGGRVLRALLGFRFDFLKATHIATWVGKIVSVGFVMLGLLYNPFLFFIGIYVFFAAAAEARAVASRHVLKGYTVNDALITDAPVVDGGVTVRDASEMLSHFDHQHFIVRSQGHPDGLLSRDDVTAALHRTGPDLPIRVLRRASTDFFPSHTPLEVAFQKMVAENIPAAVVRSGNDVIGIVDEDKLAEFILLRLRKEPLSRNQTAA